MVVEQGKKQIEAELLISPSTVKRIMKQFREDGVVTEPRGSRGTLHEDRKFGPPSWPDPQLAPHHAAEPHRAAQLLACPATRASGLPRGNQMGTKS